MRRRILAVATLAVLAISPAAVAQPPDGDPSGGNGRNGNAGCRGISTADDNRGRDPSGNSSAAGAASDLVNSILGCDG